MSICLEHVKDSQITPFEKEPYGSGEYTNEVEVALDCNRFWIFEVDDDQIVDNLEPGRKDIIFDDDAEVKLWQSNRLGKWPSGTQKVQTLSAEDLKTQYDNARANYTHSFGHVGSEVDIYKYSLFNPDADDDIRNHIVDEGDVFNVAATYASYRMTYGGECMLTDFNIIGTYSLRDAYGQFGVFPSASSGRLPCNILTPGFDSNGNMTLNFSDYANDMSLHVGDSTLYGVAESDCVFEDASGTSYKFGMFGAPILGSKFVSYGFAVSPVDLNSPDDNSFIIVDSGMDPDKVLDTAATFVRDMNHYFMSPWAFLKDKQFNDSLYDVTAPMVDYDGNVKSARIVPRGTRYDLCDSMDSKLKVQFEGDETVCGMDFAQVLESNYRAIAINDGYDVDKTLEMVNLVQLADDWLAFSTQLDANPESPSKVFLNGIKDSQIRENPELGDNGLTVNVALANNEFWSFDISRSQLIENHYMNDRHNIAFDANATVDLRHKLSDGSFEYRQLRGSELKDEYDIARRDYYLDKASEEEKAAGFYDSLMNPNLTLESETKPEPHFVWDDTLQL